MEELKLEEIAPYLPYGLECQGKKHLERYGLVPILKVNGFSFNNNYKWQYEFIHEDDDLTFAYLDDKDFKPLLYPLSMLTDKQKLNLLDSDMLSYTSDIKLIRYGDVQWLLENHFDINNLIPRGLAIDKSTIKNEV